MAKAPKTKSKSKPSRQYQVGTLPSRDAVLEAMRDHPQLDGKRDLAKYFGIHGDMRTPFKLLLKEMEGEGFLARTRKQIRRTATLPAVTSLDIPSDADPDNLHAFPSSWDEAEGEPPRVAIHVGKNARVVPAPGDRILARIDAGEGTVPVYTAKPMKILDKPAAARSASCVSMRAAHGSSPSTANPRRCASTAPISATPATATLSKSR